MADKELIKQEIEKQIDYAEDDTRYTEPYREGLIAAYQTIKAFIDNSLPEEPASKDLDFLAISLEETIGTSPHSREVIKEHLQRAAEWGINHFEDKSEMVSEDLEEASIAYSCANPSERSNGMYDQTDIEWAFEAGAEWQRKKDQETIELAEDHAMLAGMNKMKEEMMENVVEAEIFSEIKGSAESTESEFRVRSGRFKMDNIKLGDKVKIIIVKEEQ